MNDIVPAGLKLRTACGNLSRRTVLPRSEERCFGGTMNLPVCCLLAAVLGTGALTVQARERVEERRFATNGVPTLKIDCYRGSINVDSDDEPTIRVQVAASSAIENEERAEQLLQRLKFDWSQADNAITLKVANPAETGVRYLWEENQILDLVLKVTIPRTCHLDLVTKEGSLRLGEVQGNVRLKTSRGTIFCRMIDGNIFWADRARGYRHLPLSRRHRSCDPTGQHSGGYGEWSGRAFHDQWRY